MGSQHPRLQYYIKQPVTVWVRKQLGTIFYAGWFPVLSDYLKDPHNNYIEALLLLQCTRCIGMLHRMSLE